MASDYSRIHRLLKIITLIQGSDGWSAGRLSEECGVTERTIYRDLDCLEGAGIPYFFDKERKSYSIRKDFFMPPVELTLDEALALAALAERVGGNEQVPFLQSAAKAIAKIRGLLPVKIRKELEAVESHVQIHLAAASSQDGTEDVYSRVRQAIATRRVLRCQYESLDKTNSKSVKPFLLHPYALFWGQRAWYVLGHHERHNEVRCLRLSRFTNIQLTDDPYEVDPKFSVDKHFGNAWRMMKGEKRHQVELLFDAQFADTVSETHWHKSQELEFQDDGSLIFRCNVDGLDEIVWWILSMGPHCVVRKPKELIQQIERLAEDLLKKYRDSPAAAVTAPSVKKRTLARRRA